MRKRVNGIDSEKLLLGEKKVKVQPVDPDPFKQQTGGLVEVTEEKK